MRYRCTKCGRESLELVLRTATKSCGCGGVAERFEEPEELARQGKFRAPAPSPGAPPTRSARPPARRPVPPVRLSESQIQAAILRALAYRHRDVFAWRNNSGALENAKGKHVRFGLTGSADILGVARGGVFLGLEVKSPTGKPTKEQLEFAMRVAEKGGVYAVVRSVDEAMAAVDRAIAAGGQRR